MDKQTAEHQVYVGPAGKGMSVIPDCPECGGTLSVPPRMGMSVNDCKCDGCAKTFSLGELMIHRKSA